MCVAHCSSRGPAAKQDQVHNSSNPIYPRKLVVLVRGIDLRGVCLTKGPFKRSGLFADSHDEGWSIRGWGGAVADAERDTLPPAAGILGTEHQT